MSHESRLDDLPRGLDIRAVAREIGLDLPEGGVVNLGIGLPQAVGDQIPASRGVILHAENGVLGIGTAATQENADPDLIDAGKRPITLMPGAAILGHPESFAIIRGGHLDACVLGAYQVPASGDLANWSTGDARAPAVGGAMDLVRGAKSVWILMNHRGRDGRSKIVPSCTLPLTGTGVVDRVYTEYGVFEPAGATIVARALAVPIDVVRAATPGIDIAVDPACVALPRQPGAAAIELRSRPFRSQPLQQQR